MEPQRYAHARGPHLFRPRAIDTIDSSINWAGSAPLLEIPRLGGDDQMALARLFQARLVFCQGNAGAPTIR